ncbi:hypothetical protein [Stenomitos frigidus]|uniref:Uncharacterized protein n=1 Tax=Stenomitos frigidus ULC18 TaxID=2107698 RepID=A0A2T1EN52_9CYAN|nr:hypothetical protein [Stenomitos frigidus]PSB34133.1 hypothetical protein C7B82_03305 [Stenomitos frigidus ULC18]
MQLITPLKTAAQSTPSKQAQPRLEAARQKLLAPHVPPLLRMTAFLRLSCSTLEAPGAYSQLMQALFSHHPTWWQTCEVTAAGALQSSDPEIQLLLAVVSQLHAPQDLLLAA